MNQKTIQMTELKFLVKITNYDIHLHIIITKMEYLLKTRNFILEKTAFEMV
jgi:hypothetical protein